MKSKYFIIASTLIGLMVLSGCMGGSYKDCGDDKACIEDAIYSDCEKATAELGDKTVTVKGESSYGSSELGAIAKLCIVNFKYADSEKTCAFPVHDKKTIEWYEWADEYCKSGSSPPKSFGS